MVIHLLLSLALSTAFSFLAPVGIVGSMLASLWLLQGLPLCEAFGQSGLAQLNLFLGTFGSGSALQGLVVIGLTCSVVGVLFDAFAFYRHHQFQGLEKSSAVVQTD
jgi:hypothetical protein